MKTYDFIRPELFVFDVTDKLADVATAEDFRGKWQNGEGVGVFVDPGSGI